MTEATTLATATEATGTAPAEASEDLVKAKEARRILGGLPYTTFRRYVVKGLIPVAEWTLGGHRLFSRSVLAELRGSLRRGPAAAAVAA